jgi:hypothetical protein
MLIDLLKNAVESGTGKKAKISGYEVAGKTGTNSDYASVFFAGITCKYTSVVWIGHDMPSNKLETSSTGGDYAAVLWNRYMTKLMEGAESKPIIPENESTLGLVQRTVCPISGKLATDACIHYRDSRKAFSKYKTITDWFSYSNVPTDTCDMHVTLSICKQSGSIAGKFCNPDEIEEITYVLLRPGNQFYDLEDSVLDRLFEDTWVRTDRSISQFIMEFPVCTIDSSFDALKQKGDLLIQSVEDLLSENDSISDSDAYMLQSLIEQMQNASSAEEYHKAYDKLLQEYNRLISEP